MATNDYVELHIYGRLLHNKTIIVDSKFSHLKGYHWKYKTYVESASKMTRVFIYRLERNDENRRYEHPLLVDLLGPLPSKNHYFDQLHVDGENWRDYTLENIRIADKTPKSLAARLADELTRQTSVVLAAKPKTRQVPTMSELMIFLFGEDGDDNTLNAEKKNDIYQCYIKSGLDMREFSERLGIAE